MDDFNRESCGDFRETRSGLNGVLQTSQVLVLDLITPLSNIPMQLWSLILSVAECIRAMYFDDSH